MNIAFVLLFIFLTYLSPVEIIPALAPYRPVLVTAMACSLFSALSFISTPNLAQKLGNSSQFFLMLGLWGTIIASRAVHGWFGGALQAVVEFGIVAAVFFFIVLNFHRPSHLRILAIAMIVIALLLVTQGIAAYFFGYGGEKFLYTQKVVTPEGPSAYYRIRAAGFLADPNDLAQYFLVVIPLLGLFWRKRNLIFNLLFILTPGLYLLTGIFLTRSRGALLGLALVVLLTLRDRLGYIMSGVVTGMGIVVLLAMNFTGGRDVSVSAGSGRLDAWSSGLTMLKGSPLLGVGFDMFTEYHEITAHNSFVLCFAELGLFGYFIWLGLSVTSLVQLSGLAHTEDMLEDQFVLRWARAVRISLMAFLATAWFLSRTYSPTLYILWAMAVVLGGMVMQTAKQARPVRLSWSTITAGLEFASVIIVYVVVNLRV